MFSGLDSIPHILNQGSSVADYSGSSVAPAFWKLTSHPGYPAVVTRVLPDGPVEVARFEVPQEADVVPKPALLGKGLFQVQTWYANALGEMREKNRYVLISGPYSVLVLTDGLGSAIEGACAVPAGFPSQPTEPQEEQ